MSSTRILQIGQALRDVLKTIESFKYGYSPDEIPESLPGTPAFVIFLAGVNYPDNQNTHRMVLTLRLQIFLCRLEQKTKLGNLLKYLEPQGDDSIDNTIRNNWRLGGKCDWIHIVNNTGLNTLEYQGISYFGTEFEIECISRFPYLDVQQS